jgi:hypothetical protein
MLLKINLLNQEEKIMVKKIVKFILVVMMLAGAFIVVTNLTTPVLHGKFYIATYYPEIPNCTDFPSDCNVFEQETGN